MDELIRLLHEGGYSCVIRKEEIRTFTQRGVADLYDLLNQHPVFLHGAQVADKVVGKAAAALMVLGGVREVYTDIISEPALAVLHKANIRVECVQIVSRIWNRNRTGWCPLETLCYELESPEAMYPVIQNFVERMRSFGSSLRGSCLVSNVLMMLYVRRVNVLHIILTNVVCQMVFFET